MNRGIKVLGLSHAAPENVVDNHYFESILDTSDEWIRERTGIVSRHFTTGPGNTYYSAKAAAEAIEKAGIDKEDIGIVIVCTFSADNFVPSTASLLQKELSLPEDIIAFDLNAACSGFVFGMETARALLYTSPKKYAVLVGAEIISRKLDFTDRNTCILFGDGAGAAVLGRTDECDFVSLSYSRGDEEGIVCSTDPVEGYKVKMEGRRIYRFAVSTVPKAITDLMDKAGVPLSEVKHVVLHQANERIIDSIQKSLKLPPEAFFSDVATFGNTSGASVAIAFSELSETGRLKRGDRVVLSGFGAGLTWGACTFIY